MGDRLARLRRLAQVTQESLSERSGVSVDVIRKLEQHRKHSARLPTLHKLAAGLGVEITGLLGDPPALSNTEDDSPALVAVRRAIMPSPLASVTPEPDAAEPLSLDLVTAEIAEGWTLYHAAKFGRLTQTLPGMIEDARLAVAVSQGEQRRAQAALGKALQLGGHLTIRLGKTDLALSSLERASLAADSAEDPLLAAVVSNSVSWAYQRQNRWDDSQQLAVHAADDIEGTSPRTAEEIRVWGGLLISAARSVAVAADYEQASDIFDVAEGAAGRDTPPSWRNWLLLDVARAYTDVGDAEAATRTLENARRQSPQWMRHQTLAVAIVRDLWAGTARPSGLRKLAEFLGVIG